MISNRSFRFLVIGQFISAIGDQFYLIAMPWLALELTGSGVVAGTVLAVASLPRAVFMLIGGAVTDRYSARALLIGSNGLQGVLMALLALAVLSSYTQLWFLYSMGFLTGLVDAFGLPAFNTMLPQVVAADQLEGGNILLQGANMASGAIGPALAAALIAATAGAGPEASLTGIGTAFLVDAATYMIGISFFWAMWPQPTPERESQIPESLLDSLRTLREIILQDAQLRTLLGLMVVLGLFLTGTIRVGFPLLAERQYGGGVQAFGNMTSSFGLGLLLGMAALRWLPSLPPQRSGLAILALFAVLPAGLMFLGLTHSLPASLLMILMMGAALGYVMIYLLSWLQRRTPVDLLGRMMAVTLFATIGLSPLSQLLMGFALDRNLRNTFIGVGMLVLLLLLFVATDQRMRSLEPPRDSSAQQP
ncbi:MAG: MFS transporter [Anaerolineales bacterium]